ncbi:NAD(P)(+)--arginine ADP-ribosyltransferase 2 [Taeniopygia guttata]|uniref:NAD(P)(+)--arginine ADP-ribosyltransferase 2 n=1 Tax=Taeniopygia guttata TaxID=59729 RepID=UPI0013F22B17
MAPLAQTLALLAMAVAAVAFGVVPLDMAPNSFDDQYLNCGPAMAAALPALNSSEFQQNKAFAQVWVKATAEWQKQRSKSSALSPAQAIAVMAYTMNDVYEQFNAAVRTAGKSSQQYRDNFHFKTLHFLLTQALQKLRDPKKCWNVCRGAKPVQSTLKVGETVRFGQFASSSLKKYEAQCFEKGAMFEVYTCHGADIHEFSRYQYEQEVLIPPFETFQVIDVKKESHTMKIVLRSTGNSSNYNCEWLRGGSLPRNSPHLGGLLLATVAMVVAIGAL